jgi:hypothetical protein
LDGKSLLIFIQAYSESFECQKMAPLAFLGEEHLVHNILEPMLGQPSEKESKTAMIPKI